MPYINLPPTVSELFWEQDKRIARLETAYRFNAPNLNFSTSTPTNPRIGDIYYDTNISVMKYWNGTIWVQQSDSNLGALTVAFNSTWSGTGLAYTGTPAVGVYQRTGKQIHFTIKVTCTTVTNFGSGNYSLTLPFPSAYDYLLANAGMHDVSTGVHYVLTGDLAVSSNVITMYHPTSNGSLQPMKFNQPKTLTTTDYWYISGNYIATT